MARQGAEAVAVRLGSLLGQAQAQLDGFKSRTLRAAAPAQRDLYASEWRALDAAEAASAPTLVIGGELAGIEPVGTRGSEYAALVMASQREPCARRPICAVAAALALAQTQASAAAAPTVWLLTSIC